MAMRPKTPAILKACAQFVLAYCERHAYFMLADGTRTEEFGSKQRGGELISELQHTLPPRINEFEAVYLLGALMQSPLADKDTSDTCMHIERYQKDTSSKKKRSSPPKEIVN